MSVPTLGATIGSLVSLGVDELLIADLRTFLGQSADELEGSKPDTINGQAFGASPASQQCSSDAGKARQHVADALVDMAAGLVGYATVVGDLQKDTDRIEGDSTNRFNQIRACFPDSAAEAGTCPLPSQVSGGNG